MKVVLQRVTRAQVTVDEAVVGAIGHGLVALVGIHRDDDAASVDALARKTAALRIFDGPEGGAVSVCDVGGEVLVVSQFTLLADTRKGTRPSWIRAARPEHAAPLVEHFCDALRKHGIHVETGRFGAAMQVELVNDGPVTIVLDVGG